MTVPEKLDLFRALMKKNNIDAYIIVTDDFHASEYVGEHFKEREYMSGFTGSAGTLVVLPDRAALWTDGRYFLQAERELSESTIELMRAYTEGVPTISEFLFDNLGENAVIGFDGRTVNTAFAEEIRAKVKSKNITFASDKDLVESIWRERPPLSAEKVWEMSELDAGESRSSKLARIRSEMQKSDADILLVTALDEAAWLLNLRGNDVNCIPVFLSYMLITKEEARLFANKDIFDATIIGNLKKDGITLENYDAIYEHISKIPPEKRIWADGGTANYRILSDIPSGVSVINKPSPIILMKAKKNKTELENIRAAHIKDGVAVTKFICWLKHNVGKEKITELDAVNKLESIRKEQDGYIGPSFESIIAYGEHGAIIHYAPTEKSNAELQAREFCLCDVGGHYKYGTTDITRTVALGEPSKEEKRIYTLVLRGHLELGNATFAYGMCGENLDILARAPLWENGLDFNHGTGHGVGYLLSVHEGPQRIHWRISPKRAACVLEEGMIFSNEPGVYLEGKFGVRTENMVEVCKSEKNEYGQYMKLVNLTYVPYDREAVDKSLLSEREIALYNEYSAQVYEKLSPYFSGDELEWLKEETKEL